MTALLLILAIVPTMWIGQTILRRIAGLPPRRRLSADGAPHWVRIGCRAVTQGAIVGVIAGDPWLRGRGVIDHYAAMLPRGRWLDAVDGVGVALLYLGALYLAWNLAGGVRFSVRHPARRLARRLGMTPLTALFGAGVEELLFRGVLLRGLLESGMPITPAVALTTLCFAGAHYVRDVKRKWTFAGHVALGLCLSCAFVWTDQSLWLPFGLHAGGILIIMGARPFVRYEGPQWITGQSVFPYSGAVGVAALLILTAALRFHYG